MKLNSFVCRYCGEKVSLTHHCSKNKHLVKKASQISIKEKIEFLEVKQKKEYNPWREKNIKKLKEQIKRR